MRLLGSGEYRHKMDAFDTTALQQMVRGGGCGCCAAQRPKALLRVRAGSFLPCAASRALGPWSRRGVS